MKDLNLNELEKILTIIKANPSTTISLFTDKDKNIIKFLFDFTNKKEIEFHINIVDKSFYEKIKNSFINTKYFSLKRTKYLLNGKFYDYLFVNLDLEDKDIFLKKVHSIIKNSGLILIFVKKDYKTIDEYYQLLEDNYYVATSCIDIDNENRLIISRKMHGWGG